MKLLLLPLLVAGLTLQLCAQSPDANWTFHTLPGDGPFTAIHQAKDGKIYVAGGLPNSIFRVYDGNTWTLYNDTITGIPAGFMAKDITVDSNGSVWLAGDGIARWVGINPATVFNYANSDLNNPVVHSIAVDKNNLKWLTSVQSFDGDNFNTIDKQGCVSGTLTRVFVARNNDVWISGTYTNGVDGMAVQPCVFRVVNNTATAFRENNGHLVPHLAESTYTHHLIGELSDSTIFIVGRGFKLELKKFVNGNWVPWASKSVMGTGVGNKLNSLWVDKNNNVLIGATQLSGKPQIIKYCAGNFTLFNFPANVGFPLINDLMVDAHNNIWLVGNSGICSSPYNLTDCSIVSQTELAPQAICQKLYYAESSLFVDGCGFDAPTLHYRMFNVVGQLIKSGTINGQSSFIGALQQGVYFVALQLDDGTKQLVKVHVD